MRIEYGSNPLHVSQRAQTSAAAGASPASPTSFSSALAAATAATSAARQADFTGMTRQEMFDWMNGQIRSGKMSLDESLPFLGMTMKISAATGQPVDMATDNTRIDFIEKARSGIEGALSRSDPDSAGRLQAAMEIMCRKQG